MKNFIYSTYGKISCTILGAGGLSLLIYVLNRWPKPKPKPETEPTLGPNSKPTLGPKSISIFLRELHGGYRAWNRLETETYKEAQVSRSAQDCADALKQELQKELPNLMILQQNVEDLENLESEEKAKDILEPALEKAKNDEKPHEAYEIGMLLVEVLIYKGDLEAALEYDCLKDESLKDARRPLFKAIIHQMQGLENITEAKKHWEDFLVVRDPTFRREIDFEQFTRHVERLRQANDKQNREKSRTH